MQFHDRLCYPVAFSRGVRENRRVFAGEVAMKPARFDYYDPRTLDEAVAILSEHAEDGKVLAGGQSLVPLLNMRLARPGVIVDVNRVTDSDYVRAWDGGVAIGMTARQRALQRDELITGRLPLLSEASQFIGHPQIRSRGTICGSLAHADPAAELPACMIALDAVFHLRSARAQRACSARDFFLGLLSTALEPDELLAGIEVPGMPAARAGHGTSPWWGRARRSRSTRAASAGTPGS
jgi:carbon-monoxide dehydrogenase medium subunit